jgi:RNA polymerase sigma factor (sigma-70 family)
MDSSPRQPGAFATTRWSVILAARGNQTPEASAALAALCESYWYPLYVFLRRRGYPAADAQDLTQEFFANLLEHHSLDAANRDRGRFRTFLLMMLKRFLSKQRERNHAQKRGGGIPTLSLEFYSAEERFCLEPADDWTPEKAYHRRWALTILDRVLHQLNAEYTEKGKGELFERCRVFLSGQGEETSHAEVARSLGMTPGAVKVSIHRMRQRYRQRLHEAIADTVSSPDEVRSEMHLLLAALRGEEG